jgi:DNA repair exonuclease SbcCD nuclease subunit
MSGKKAHSKALDLEEIQDEVDPKPLNEKLRKDISRLKSQINQLKQDRGFEEDYFLQLQEALQPLAVMPMEYTAPKKKQKTEPISAVLVCSDWHIGSDIDPDEIEQVNAFNHDIATKRVRFLTETFLRIVETKRKAFNIDELVIICNGDMISGDIHDELTNTNEWPAPVQSVQAAVLFSDMVANLSRHFKKVRVEFVVADNHSRLTVRNQFKEGGKNSYNYIVGWVAQDRLAKHKNVEYNLHPVLKAMVSVQGRHYLVHHGHTIKGWAGFPWYGADRAVSVESKARKFTDRQFHRIIMGHFHTPLNTQEYIYTLNTGRSTGTLSTSITQTRNTATKVGTQP